MLNDWTFKLGCLTNRIAMCVACFLELVKPLIQCGDLTHDHKLRKYLSLILDSESKYIEFNLTNCINNLQIWTTNSFKHSIKILVYYQNYFKSYFSSKFWLKNILTFWSWSQVSFINYMILVTQSSELYT